MRFRVERVSVMDIEGIEDPEEARAFMQRLSEDTVGMVMPFEGRPVTYVDVLSVKAEPVTDEEGRG